MNTPQFISDLMPVCPEKATMLALSRIQQRGELGLLDEFLSLLEAAPSPERSSALDAWYATLSPDKQKHMASDVARLKAQVAQ